MGASDPLGEEKYWFEGLPFKGIKNSSADTRSEKFWFEGLPADYIFPATTSTKTASSDSYIKSTTSKTVLSDSYITTAGATTQTKTILSDSYLTIIQKVTLVSPSTLGSTTSPVNFTWEIPQATGNKNVYSNLRIDTSNSFDSGNLVNYYSHVNSGFEFYTGSSWDTYPTTGIGSAYYGNQARRETSLNSGSTWYWEVRGGVTV